jgi:two-component system response regulator
VDDPRTAGGTSRSRLVAPSTCQSDFQCDQVEENHLVNRIVVLENGVEALDYLYERGRFEKRSGGNPIVVLLDNKMPKVNGLGSVEDYQGR